MNIDERLEALTMNLELAHREIQDLQVLARQDGENIRALAVIAQTQDESIRGLARIADNHERRITSLEDGE